MSDSSSGEGWWQASDGKWYPPEAATDTAQTPEEKRPWWRKRWVAVVAGLVVVLGIASAVSGGEDGPEDEASETEAVVSDSEDEPVEPTVADEAEAEAPEPTERSTATPAPTATPEPPATPTPQPTATPAPVPFEPIVRSGSGNEVVLFDQPVGDALIARMSHTGSSNFQVTLFDENGDRVDGIANEIGTWTGEMPVNFRDGDSFSFMEVTADGSWEIVFDELLTATPADTDSGSVYEGVGSEVLLFVTDGPTVIDVSCPACDSNVQIQAWGDRRTSVANEIGDAGYTGSHLVPAGTLILHVNMHAGFRTGPPVWTITVE